MRVPSPQRTYLAGLIGRGIAQSRSPEMHEREAAAQGLPLVYRIIDFDRLEWADGDVERVVANLRCMGFDGINVTHPFKRRVIPALTGLSDAAAALGAVNTIVFRDGGAVGHNTDWSGFLRSFDAALPGVPVDDVAQIGCGGAGAATGYALLQAGTRRLRLFDVDRDGAHALADRLAGLFPDAAVVVARGPDAALDGADGVVQASPVGMSSHPGLPFDPALLTARSRLAEIIYFPAETAIVAAARTIGCRVMTGGGMAVGQAADAFTLITGHAADPGRMLDAF